MITDASTSASFKPPTEDTSSDITRKLATALALLDDAAREHDRDICLTHIEAAQELAMTTLVALRRDEARASMTDAREAAK